MKGNVKRRRIDVSPFQPFYGIVLIETIFKLRNLFASEEKKWPGKRGEKFSSVIKMLNDSWRSIKTPGNCYRKS